MAHQYLLKIFNGPCKNPPSPHPTYLMYGPLLTTNEQVLSRNPVETVFNGFLMKQFLMDF